MILYRKFFKRAIDTTLAAGGLLVFGVPMLIIAACIKLDSKGPVFFRQERLGKGMKPFRIFKFRTMCDHAYEMGGIATSASDPRITKVGAFLRRTSLDELPQMLNILRGEMAIIGPRPILDWEFEPYKDNKRYCKRHSVIPGMFCTADIYNRALTRDEQMIYDAQYVEELTFQLDLKAFIGIFAPVLTGKGVYKDENDKVEIKQQ
ncbi:MAG: sugar transferase [Muribaculaceae bacterium]|nr:sugar transferase [Muribaculaceae bacterium]